MRSGFSVHQYVYFVLSAFYNIALHQLLVFFHLNFFNLPEGNLYFFNIEFPRNNLHVENVNICLNKS